MAIFKQVTFYIDRSSFSLGSVCSINYEYFIAFNSDEIASETRYRISCELWGDDLLVEKRLSDAVFDRHIIVARQGFHLSRNFTVPCELLNEKVGEDKVYIIVNMEQGGVLLDSIRSKVVRDSF